MNTLAPNEIVYERGMAPDRKALAINLDDRKFGTFAEIGAGQEVARHFFRVGGASNTIAKTMSAYDMTFSDEIYGKATRYVSRDRLNAMLTHEYKLLIERLSAKRGASTTFFAFANTVSTASQKRNRDSNGWLGVRYQTDPLEPPNDIIVHVRMTDPDPLQQHEALGLVGVNLIYAAFYLHTDYRALVLSLLDGLSTARIEIDMIEVSGPIFKSLDNRLVCLELLKQGLTPAIILPPDGKVHQPSESLYGRELIVARGRFQPVTHMHVDLISQAKSYVAAIGSKAASPLLLCEITLHNAAALQQLNDRQMIAQTEALSSLGYTVMISVYPEFHRLVGFFRRYTPKEIYFVTGVDTLAKLCDSKYYAELQGGMLEGLGRFFRPDVTLLLYPMMRDRFLALLEKAGIQYPPEQLEKLPDLVSSRDVKIRSEHQELLHYLSESNRIRDLTCENTHVLSIDTDSVLAQIRANDPQWTSFVPDSAALVIKRHASVYQNNGAT